MAKLPEGLEIHINAGQKIYHGFRDNGGICFIEVIEPGQDMGHPLKHEVRHSPTGFEWGYAGSGPADTARSILADYLGFVPVPGIYQRYKQLVISDLDRNDWRILAGDVGRILVLIQEEQQVTCLHCGDQGFIGDDGDRLKNCRPCSCKVGQTYAAEFKDEFGAEA